MLARIEGEGEGTQSDLKWGGVAVPATWSPDWASEDGCSPAGRQGEAVTGEETPPVEFKTRAGGWTLGDWPVLIVMSLEDVEDNRLRLFIARPSCTATHPRPIVRAWHSADLGRSDLTSAHHAGVVDEGRLRPGETSCHVLPGPCEEEMSYYLEAEEDGHD